MDEDTKLKEYYLWINERFLEMFTQRKLDEMEFANIYTGFSHGTDGHNRLLLIAKLYKMIEERLEHEWDKRA
jgi:hypothetical protein